MCRKSGLGSKSVLEKLIGLLKKIKASIETSVETNVETHVETRVETSVEKTLCLGVLGMFNFLASRKRHTSSVFWECSIFSRSVKNALSGCF